MVSRGHFFDPRSHFHNGENRNFFFCESWMFCRWAGNDFTVNIMNNIVAVADGVALSLFPIQSATDLARVGNTGWLFLDDKRNLCFRINITQTRPSFVTALHGSSFQSISLSCGLKLNLSDLYYSIFRNKSKVIIFDLKRLLFLL